MQIMPDQRRERSRRRFGDPFRHFTCAHILSSCCEETEPAGPL